VPLRYRVLAAAFAVALPLSILVGALALLTGHRFGIYLIVIALTSYSALRRLVPLLLRRGSRWSVWPGERVPDRDPSLAYVALCVLMLAGVYTAILGHRLGAWIFLSGVIGQLALDLTVAIVGYRDVMNRPWPKVMPLDDEDDW